MSLPFCLAEEMITPGSQCTTATPYEGLMSLAAVEAGSPGTESRVLTTAPPDVQASPHGHPCTLSISVSPLHTSPCCLHTCPSPQDIPPGGQPGPLSCSPAPRRNLQALRTYPVNSFNAVFFFLLRETERERPIPHLSQPRDEACFSLCRLQCHTRTRRHTAPSHNFSLLPHTPHPPSA